MSVLAQLVLGVFKRFHSHIHSHITSLISVSYTSRYSSNMDRQMFH